MSPDDHKRQRTLTTQCPTYDFDICLKRSACTPSSPVLSHIPSTESVHAIQNETLALAYLKEHTSIPVPNVIAAFEDLGAYYLLFEKLEGVVPASSAPADKHGVILSQLERYVKELHSHTSETCRSFVDTPLLSPRLGPNLRTLSRADYASDSSKPYVLCHANLSWDNVLIDPATSSIKCITTWSCAGWYPVQVEGLYCQRPGPAHALLGEEMDDVDQVVDVLYRKAVDKWKPHIRSARLAAGFEPSAMGSRTSFGSSTERLEVNDGKPDMEQKAEKSCPKKTRLQAKLASLHIPHPSNAPLTSQLLLLHTALTTRTGLVRDLEELKIDLEEDALAWAELIKGLTGEEVKSGEERVADGYENIHTLASLLPYHLQILSTQLQASSSALLSLLPILSNSPKTNLICLSEEQVSDGYYARLLLEKMNLRMGKRLDHLWDGGGVRGEVWRVVRRGEGEKWKGMKEVPSSSVKSYEWLLTNAQSVVYQTLLNLAHGSTKRPSPPIPTPDSSTIPTLHPSSPFTSGYFLPSNPLLPTPTPLLPHLTPRHPTSPPATPPTPPKSPFSPAPAISSALRDRALQARLIVAQRRAENLANGGTGYWEMGLKDELDGAYVVGGVQRPLGEGDYVDYTGGPSGAEGEGEGEGEVRVVRGIRIRGTVSDPDPETTHTFPTDLASIAPTGGITTNTPNHKRFPSLFSFSRLASLRSKEGAGERARTVSMQGEKGKTEPERSERLRREFGEGSEEVLELKRLRKRSM
ncbi:hypothetical protein IAR50_004882 [Cryptococcus sp. DSM 104548]